MQPGDVTETMEAAEYAESTKGKRNKYGAKKIVIDGHTFDSQAEYRRWQELRLMERAGEIVIVGVHPPFELVVNGVKIGRYTADFAYHLCPEGQLVIEDVKGVRTRDYVLRKKLVKALYGVDIREVTA